MSRIKENLAHVKAIELESVDASDRFVQAKRDFTEKHSPYRVGDEMVNDLEWCFSHMGKRIRVDSVRLSSGRLSAGDTYNWLIYGTVLKADGTPSIRTVKGRKTLKLTP